MSVWVEPSQSSTQRISNSLWGRGERCSPWEQRPLWSSPLRLAVKWAILKSYKMLVLAECLEMHRHTAEDSWLSQFTERKTAGRTLALNQGLLGEYEKTTQTISGQIRIGTVCFKTKATSKKRKKEKQGCQQLLSAFLLIPEHAWHNRLLSQYFSPVLQSDSWFMPDVKL